MTTTTGHALMPTDPRLTPALAAITDRLDGEKDPADAVDGMAVNFGRDVVPHVMTFQSLIGSHAKVYRDCDEATKNSLDNARYMRNDCGIMECVEARQRCVSLLGWHLKPEDEKSQSQKDLCADLTKILERIRSFTEFRYALMNAVWYGKYAINSRYGWDNVAGHMRQLPKPHTEDDYGWRPINGDKLVFRYDDGNLGPGQYPNQLGIRINGSFQPGQSIGGRYKAERIAPTDRGMAYFLPPYERKLLTVHRHIIEDAAFEDALSAGSINGVGIRSRIYWEWVQKQETLAFLMEYLERSAGGIEVWTYPQGNAQAKADTERAAKERLGGARNVVVVPKPMGVEGEQYGVQIIEPGMGGIDALKDILNTYYGHRIKRYILGQTLTSEAEATGMGSGVADAHMDTFMQIVRFDAMKLQETITWQLLKFIKDVNFPEARGIHIEFVIDVEHEDVKERLDAYESAWTMGCALKEQDVMDLIGAAMPGPDDRVLKKQEPQPMGGGVAPGAGMKPEHFDAAFAKGKGGEGPTGEDAAGDSPVDGGGPVNPGDAGERVPVGQFSNTRWQEQDRGDNGRWVKEGAESTDHAEPIVLDRSEPDARDAEADHIAERLDRHSWDAQLGIDVKTLESLRDGDADEFAEHLSDTSTKLRYIAQLAKRMAARFDEDAPARNRALTLADIAKRANHALKKWAEIPDSAGWAVRTHWGNKLKKFGIYLSGMTNSVQPQHVREKYAKPGRKPSAHQKQLLGDDQQEFRWITIGGHGDGDGGEHHGGTHVKIDKKGNIVAGPAELVAKGIKNLHDFGSAEHPEERKKSKAVKPKAPAPAEHQPGLFEPDEELGGQKRLGLGDTTQEEAQQEPAKTADEPARPKFRVLGITDDKTTCELCGKPSLKNTVALDVLDDEGNSTGEIVHYGRDCASKVLHGDKKSGNVRSVESLANGISYAKKWLGKSDKHSADVVANAIRVKYVNASVVGDSIVFPNGVTVSANDASRPEAAQAASQASHWDTIKEVRTQRFGTIPIEEAMERLRNGQTLGLGGNHVVTGIYPDGRETSLKGSGEGFSNMAGSLVIGQPKPSDTEPTEHPSEEIPDHVELGELNRMDRKIERLKGTMDSRRKIFEQPQQTPGPMVTGRSGYTQGKKLDAENDRKATAFREHEEARREYERMQSIRDGYIKGTNHPNGQPRVPGAVEARQAAKERNREKVEQKGFDTRKIYRDVNMDGKSTLPDGTVVSMNMDFDSDDGGYQFVVTRPDGTVERTPFAGSIARLQSGGELRKILSKSKSTAAETVPQQSEPDGTAPPPDQSTGPNDGDRNAEGLVFRDGRWHREDEQEAAQEGPAATATPPVETSEDTSTQDESGPLSLERLSDRQKRLNNGDVTAEELKRWYSEARDPANLEAVKAELSKKTVDELKKMGAQGFYGREKKADLIESILDRIGEEYHVGDRGVSFQIGGPGYKKSKESAYQKAIDAITDDHIKAHAEKVAARRAELQSRRDAFIKSVENPETLEDFDKLARVKGGEENLTPEQRQQYDEVRATSRRSKSVEEAAKKASVSGLQGGEQVTGGVGIVEGHHQKRNAPTFTVTVENHLGDKWDEALSRAKRLGGSYVNARIAKAYDATPGFQFFDKEKAEQFANVLRGESVDRTEDFEKEQAERAASRAASLQDRGADIVGAGESDLGRDRKDNTARRAAMAASAESSARAKIATGKTLQAIGEKMESGDLKHLGGVKAATHVDTLNSLLRRTRYERWTEENTKRRRAAEEAIKESRGKLGRWDAEKQADEKHGGPLPDYDTFHEAPSSEDDIAAVKYPYPRMWQSDLRQHAEQFADVPGLKKIAATLKKAATEQVKFQGSVGGMKASGGSLVSPKSIEEQFEGKLLGVDPDKKIRVHASWDWRLAQASQAQGGRNSGQFYTADKGKTWSDTPEKAALVAYNKNVGQLDLVDAPEDKLVTFDDPKDIEAMQTAASRLRRNSNPNMKRVAENLAWQLEDYKRMQAMDIQSPAELRAALREYLPLRAGVDREDPIKKMERALRGRKIEGFFPTPKPLIDKMLDVAGIEPGHSVLEPSAGKGDILDAVREREPEAQTEAIEPVGDLRSIIEAKGHKLAANDFLSHKGQYDRIVMNPPFEKGADIDHVRHAYDQLKPGGRLVAIMSEGPFSRSDKKAEEFRNWLDANGGEHEQNPEGSFAGGDAFRQTGVQTRLVTINKPTAEQYSRRQEFNRTVAAFDAAFNSKG